MSGVEHARLHSIDGATRYFGDFPVRETAEITKLNDLPVIRAQAQERRPNPFDVLRWLVSDSVGISAVIQRCLVTPLRPYGCHCFSVGNAKYPGRHR